MEQGAPMTAEQTSKRRIPNWIEHVDENEKSVWIGKYCILLSTVFKYTNQIYESVCRIKPTSLNGSLFKKIDQDSSVFALDVLLLLCLIWHH